MHKQWWSRSPTWPLDLLGRKKKVDWCKCWNPVQRLKDHSSVTHPNIETLICLTFSMFLKRYSFRIKIDETVDFLLQFWPLVLFKKLCKNTKTWIMIKIFYMMRWVIHKIFKNYQFLIKRTVNLGIKSQRYHLFWYEGSTHIKGKI